MQSFYCAAVFLGEWVEVVCGREGDRQGVEGSEEVGILSHHALPHFPFFSLRWNFLRRRVHTSLHWITRLFLSASRPTRSAVAGPPAEAAAPLAEATAGAGPAAGTGPAPALPSLPPITRKRLLIWILGHLQARSFMWTHRMLSPRFKGSPRLLYTDTTFTENLAQSPTVSMSSTLTWTAVDKVKKEKKKNKEVKSQCSLSLFININY